MKKAYLLVLALILVSCSTPPRTEAPSSHPTASAHTEPAKPVRNPSGVDLTGTYLGEGHFSKRKESGTGMTKPAIRFYMQRIDGEADSYYGVLLEYDKLLNMALPYLSSQKMPALNHVVGYLDKIATRISAYKLVPGYKDGVYHLHNLEVQDGRIVPAAKEIMVLTLDAKNKSKNPFAGAIISGNSDGLIFFPKEEQPSRGFFGNIAEALTFSQFKLASFVYKKGHLASTWRGNWNDLEGSYLSEYGRLKDGVLELYSDNGQPKAKFVKTNTTKAKNFTNPKSATIEGDYIVTEPIPKMYVLVAPNGAKTGSDKEMVGRIGLFLDVFDASAPEAGGHLVTEIAFTNPQDPEDFMMYYQHPKHLKNVGVEPKSK